MTQETKSKIEAYVGYSALILFWLFEIFIMYTYF